MKISNEADKFPNQRDIPHDNASRGGALHGLMHHTVLHGLWQSKLVLLRSVEMDKPIYIVTIIKQETISY